ncbi:ATP-binding protein [Micromonospora sp. NPDC048830]|uniref:ATP-binding protein n=1 Tax=Micromonospora sp. NPDC048830 TaxID=3364257 RepID=UPI00371778A5
MGSLRTSPPPPHATELQRWELGTGAELRGLRASLHEALTGHALGAGEQLDDIPERVVLVATELATNALKHGLPPTTVRLLCADDVFILDVADHDLSTVPEFGDTDPLGAGGRGLQLAHAFSLDVGWYATPHAKHIWASFPREAEPAR